jgi:DNA polymerase
MAKARAYSLPGSLGKAADALKTEIRKDKNGTRLLNKFSRGEPRLDPNEHPDGHLLYEYCVQDVQAEQNVSRETPELSDSELQLWLIHNRINHRGVQIDTQSLDVLIKIVDQVFEEYKREIPALTNNAVSTISQIKAIRDWMQTRGVATESLNAQSVSTLLDGDLPDDVRKLLKIRVALSSASVKKLYSIKRRLSSDGRLRDLFMFHRAKTGRWAGAGPQPQNLPNGGPDVKKCLECTKNFRADADKCPWCDGVKHDCFTWNIECAEQALYVAKMSDLRTIEHFYGDPLSVVSGCLRSLFCAKPSHELICSDFSSIEAVVLAEVAGEKWRQEVFRTHGRIYEESAALITGIPFDPDVTHPHRRIGKVAELAAGYGGGLKAWQAFGADKHMSEEQIVLAVNAWREKSPLVVALWNKLEDLAKEAIYNPNVEYEYRGVGFQMRGDNLYCILPSGRELTYHKAKVQPRKGITFWGDSTIGWKEHNTYGGRLTENVVQAIARDILANSLINLDAAGFNIVLHVHDEIVAEIPRRTCSVEYFEKIMSVLPHWCKDWPVRVAGGWIGGRYRK